MILLNYSKLNGHAITMRINKYNFRTSNVYGWNRYGDMEYDRDIVSVKKIKKENWKIKQKEK